MVSGLDIVFEGIDFCGTSTQVGNARDYLINQGNIIKDLRGGNVDALFHSLNTRYASYQEFLKKNGIPHKKKTEVSLQLQKMAQNSAIPSMRDNLGFQYIDPHNANFWIMEEPSRKSTGQAIREYEQRASKYGSKINNAKQADLFSDDRIILNMDFRYPILKAGRNLLRSRSEASSFLYQWNDSDANETGIPLDDILNKPGNQMSLSIHPTHIFICHGPIDWKEKDYLALRKEREGSRFPDDMENKIDYQLHLNRGYADPDKLEAIYQREAQKNNIEPPEFIRLNVYDNEKTTQRNIENHLARILHES